MVSIEGEIQDTDEYKRLYAKYSANRPKKGPSAAVQAAFAKSGLAPPGIAEAGGAYSTFEDLSRNGNSVAPPVPGLEDADPHADVPAGKLPAMSADDHAKLDEYKICGRCQGMGEYKEFMDMGHGAMREITKYCDSDNNGAPCDGGLVPRRWKPGDADPRNLNFSTAPVRASSSTTSGGKFDGTRETSPETEAEIEAIEKEREVNAGTALRGVEPTYRVGRLAPEDEEEDEWLSIGVDLPLIESASMIDASIRTMKFLELEVPGVYSLDLELPEYVDDEDMECSFNTETKELTVKLPVVRLEQEK